MDIKPYLYKECIELDTDAKGKDELLRRIAKLSKVSNVLKDFSEDFIYTKLKDREEISTTGFGKEIAIPHCSIEDIDNFVLGLITSKEGVDFDSLDGSPTKVFVFIIGPQAQRNEHISILSGFSKLLINRESVDFLIESESQVEVYDFLIKHVQFEKQKPAEGSEKCLFHIIIQEESLFEEILQILSASSGGGITVVESSNAGNYLHTMPLFASFWSERSSAFNRIIIAVLDKSLCNDMVRQINTVSPTDKPGVLIAVHDLFYAGGSINF